MSNLLPVQPFQETLHAGMCGPASLKMVLEYYGVEKTEKELAELCGTDPDLGKKLSNFGLCYCAAFNRYAIHRA